MGRSKINEAFHNTVINDPRVQRLLQHDETLRNALARAQAEEAAGAEREKAEETTDSYRKRMYERNREIAAAHLKPSDEALNRGRRENLFDANARAMKRIAETQRLMSERPEAPPQSLAPIWSQIGIGDTPIGPHVSGEASESIIQNVPAYIRQLGQARAQRGIEILAMPPTTFHEAELAPQSEVTLAAHRDLLRGIEDARDRRNGLYANTDHLLDRAADTDIDARTRGYLDQADDRRTPSYIRDYLAQYMENVENPARENAEAHFKRYIAPKIAASVSSSGGGVTPREIFEVEKARREYMQDLNRNLMAQRNTAFERGMGEARQNRSLSANLAHLQGNLLGSHQEQLRANVGALTDAEKVKYAHLMADHANATSVGNAQQAYEQAQKDAAFDANERQRIERLQNYQTVAAPENAKFQQLYRSPNVVDRNTPQQSFLATAGNIANHFSNNAGAPIQAAHGGLIRGHYAAGGQVNPMTGQYQYPNFTDQQLPAFNTPEIAQMRQYANNVGQTRNPTLDVLGRLALNISATPEKGVGGNSLAAWESHDREMHNEKMRQVQAANLQKMINDTRMDRHKILVDFEKDKRDFELKRRLDESTIDMHKASADLARVKAGAVGSGVGRIPRKLDKGEMKILETVAKDLEIIPEMENDLDRMETLASKIDSGGAMSKIPFLKDPSISGNIPGFKTGSQEDLEEFDKIANDFVVKETQKFGGRGGIRLAQLVGEGKPRRQITKEANLNVINRRREGYEKKRDEALFINEAYTEHDISPRKAQNAFSKYNSAIKKNPALAKELTPYDFLAGDKPAGTMGKGRQKDESEDYADNDSDELAAIEAENAELERQLAGKR